MKKLLMIGIAAFACAAMAQDKAISLADARNQIGDAIASADKMTSVMKQLSAADQKTFLGEVNKAISKQPGSSSSKAAKFLDANKAAMKAQKGNLAELMAETYATVPPEALTVINEKFASDLINRDADPANKVTDEQFTAKATETMKTIQERAASSDNAGVRDTFGALMFLRASNGKPETLRDTLVANLPDAETRDLAQNEWITPALAGNYDPILGAADAGEAPELVEVLRQSGPNTLQAMLGDLAGGEKMAPLMSSALNPTQYAMPEISEDYGLDRIPRSLHDDAKWNNSYKRGNLPNGEPQGYPWQR